MSRFRLIALLLIAVAATLPAAVVLADSVCPSESECDMAAAMASHCRTSISATMPCCDTEIDNAVEPVPQFKRAVDRTVSRQGESDGATPIVSRRSDSHVPAALDEEGPPLYHLFSTLLI